ncbi:MAG: hypothetical protein ACE5EE_05250 [Fidelibacterota bacterium]
MKFSFIILLIISSLIASDPEHQIVYLDGSSKTGWVAAIDHDSVAFRPKWQQTVERVPLDSLFLIHNGAGKYFYLSQTFWRYINLALGRSGSIITVEGREIEFTDLEAEIRMYHPKLIYRTIDNFERRSIPLHRVHKLNIDHTLSEYAVKKGGLSGAGLSLFAYLVQFKATKEFFDFNLVFKRANKLYPTAFIGVPLITMGWVTYDFLKGQREFIFNPLR